MEYTSMTRPIANESGYMDDPTYSEWIRLNLPIGFCLTALAVIRLVNARWVCSFIIVFPPCSKQHAKKSTKWVFKVKAVLACVESFMENGQSNKFICFYFPTLAFFFFRSILRTLLGLLMFLVLWDFLPPEAQKCLYVEQVRLP